MKFASLMVAAELAGSVVLMTSCFFSGNSGCGNCLAGSADPPGGNVHAFDPIASISAVTAFAGAGSQLVEIKSTGVRSTGTQDLEAQYYPETEYDFVRPAQQHSDLPVGAQPVTTQFENIRVSVKKPVFTEIVGQGSFFDRGMDKDTSNTKDGPPSDPFTACKFADLWKLAETRGAPADAVAKISYSGASWTFDIVGTATSLVFDAECALVAQ